MGIHCCKDERKQEISEPDNYNQNTYGNTYTCNHEDVFKTRPPCMYGHQCSCPCHRCGKCIFKNGIPTLGDKVPKTVSPTSGISFQKRYPRPRG